MGSGSIKWKITKACFYADRNEAEEGEFVAGVNSDEYRSAEKSRGNWPQITSTKRTSLECGDRCRSSFTDLLRREGVSF